MMQFSSGILMCIDKIITAQGDLKDEAVKLMIFY